MNHMRQATVRDLRYHFPEIENLLQEGEEEYQCTKRKRAIARPVPERPAAPAALPDFTAMLKEIYGNKSLKVGGRVIGPIGTGIESYLDSSVLASLYAPDAHSASALEYCAKRPGLSC